VKEEYLNLAEVETEGTLYRSVSSLLPKFDAHNYSNNKRVILGNDKIS
jgi:hypothetical protein